MNLVISLRNWVVSTNYLGDNPILQVDSPDSAPHQIPPNIDGSRPDIYGRSRDFQFELIGEAKTSSDLDTKHSAKQFSSYLKWCALSEMRTFVLATEWDHVRYAYATLKKLTFDLNIKNSKFAVQDEFGQIRAKSNDWI